MDASKLRELAKDWTPPAELAASPVPRTVRLTTSSARSNARDAFVYIALAFGLLLYGVVSPSRNYSILAFAGIPVCLMFSTLGWLLARRLRRILRNGTPACAYVTGVRRQESRYRLPGLEVDYVFLDSAGNLHRRTSSPFMGEAPQVAGKEDFWAMEVPRTVLYDPGKPSRSALYPFQYVVIDGVPDTQAAESLLRSGGVAPLDIPITDE